MAILKKLRSLPESQRKMIALGAVIILGLVAVYWRVMTLGRQLKDFQKTGIFKALDFPIGEFKEKIKEVSDINMEVPEFTEEELKIIEEGLQEAENQTSSDPTIQ